MRLGAARIICMVAGLFVIASVLRADANPSGLYDRSIRRTLHLSGIPVLLPASLPKQLGSIAAIVVISADRNGYYVGYSADAACHGSLSCATLHVAGYSRSALAGRTFGSDRRVVLPDRSVAYYAARNCSGSSCVESSLTFVRRNAVYEIDAKAAPALPLLFNVYRRLRPVEPRAVTYGR